MKIGTDFLSLRVIWIGLLLLAAVVPCIAVMSQRGVRGPLQNVSLEAHIEKVTGANAVDCGRHDLRNNDEDAMMKSLRCALDAAAARKPFRTIRDQQGIDSQIAHGLLGKGDGKIMRFSYDSAPCGGPGCAERFDVGPCLSPTVSTDAGGRFSFICKG